ncbi:MAG: Wzz/FepE/Etk N-terminal domain-containing protein, partial [Gemmatimonadota bacterium]
MAQYEATLRDYWRILRRRKGIVTFTALMLGFFSFVIAYIWRPLPNYQATAKVQISLHQNLTGLYLQSIAYNSGDQIETQQAIVTSHPVLRRAGEELGL